MAPFIGQRLKSIMCFALTSVCLLGLGACSTSGRSFQSSALAKIIPEQTTLAQASALLEATPVDVYRQANGSVTARWAYKVSMVTDALYLRQELLLFFGPDGRFQYVVDSVNIPDLPTTEPNKSISKSVVRASPAVPNPLADASSQELDQPAVSYPLISPTSQP